jgi:hypothetical protein
MRRLWEYDEIPQCGTPACPLEDLAPTATLEQQRGTKAMCPCSDPEIIALRSQSVLFLRAYDILTEMEIGFPVPQDVLDNLVLKHAVITLKRELESAKRDYQDARREEKKEDHDAD